MRTKTYLIAAFVFSSLLVTNVGHSQSIVDPGVSTHNYKHPNKAAKAKEIKGDKNKIVVGTFKSNKTPRVGKNVVTTNTPKYKSTPKNLVVFRRYSSEGVEINPLNSDRHYKAAPLRKAEAKSEIASTEVIQYPNID
jgi:hypothetical protein